MSGYEFFELEVSEGLAAVTMNRPPLNVLHIPMMAEFNALLEKLVADTGLSGILIRARGKAFCAGVDVADHTAEKVGEMMGQFHGIFRKLASTDALTIAVVHRAALGGGCELACFCDIVLASERAKFGQPEVQVGVFPPVAACIFPQRVGLGKAIELVATGATIDAIQAHALGLVNQVYPAEEFEERVQEYLGAIGKLSRPVVRMAKRATVGTSREEMLSRLEEAERMYLGELMQLSDAQEGIAAFLEKRKANWRHE